MATGKVVRFDDTRGYGFITPDGGGEDVFMHANDLRDEKYLFRPGTTVAFRIEDGDKGLKASDVRIVEPPDGERHTVPRPPGTHVVHGHPGGRDDGDDALCDVLSARQFRGELTEALLETAPTLTGAQITQVRNRVIELAQAHNWVES